jgi:O-antigen ligase
MMKNTIKICLWILAFIPLIVDFKVFFPYTSGKNLLIETALVLAGILLIINFFISKSFKEEIIEKASRYIKNPLVIAILSFVFINIISTIFAVDKHIAFWGELSRAEGLTGLIFFFTFFVFSLLIFEKKDWLWFLKLSLFASLILIGREFYEYFVKHIARPESFTGNPTFLAGYLLFSITSSLVIFAEEKNKFWRSLSVIIFIFATVGIFMAQTRGTILGLGLGLISILIYCAIKGGDINYKKLNLQKISLILLCLGIIFSGIFVFTRKAEIWQKVPGLARVAVMGTGDEEDPSTSIRLYIYKSALRSVNPANESWKKTLLGWGPDNFIFADSKYYYPEQYQYEQKWYDRAHNKFLGVLVANGIFGLFAYLAIWLMFFRLILKKHARTEGFRVTNLALLLFGISYLTHLMFVFDQISTSIPFFFILAFIIYLNIAKPVTEVKKLLITEKVNGRQEILFACFIVILLVFLSFIYFKSTLHGYIQMRDYTSLIQKTKNSDFESKIDKVFTINTLAQMNMRRNFLDIANTLYNKTPDERNTRLLKMSIDRAEEYIKDQPMDFGFLTTLAGLYTKKGDIWKNKDFLKRGEELYNKVLVFAPNRPDMQIKLAVNLIYQGRFLEAFNLYEKIFISNPLVLEPDRLSFELVYTKLIQYFYGQKDKDNFIKVANRLKENNYKDSASLDKILDYLNKNGDFPRINFE